MTCQAAGDRPPVLITARTACDMLGAHYRQLRRLVAAGHVTERRLPIGRPRYDLASVQRLLSGGDGPRPAA